MAPVTRASASAAARPTTIGIGQTTVVEITVMTPPDHQVLRILPGEATAALELLDVETPPVERGPGGSRQRHRYRIRARQLGDFTWSAGAVEVAAPDGSTQRLRLEPVQLEVASLLAAYSDRTAPFGPKIAPAVGHGWRPSRPAATAGAIALIVATAWILRRRARRRRTAVSAPARAVAPWTRARTELSLARAALATDTTRAADVASTALRRYMVGRFGAAAGARTTEELATATPPYAATSRWPTFVALLRELDAQRFPRPDRRGRSAAEVRIGALLRRAEQFVEETLPPEPLR
jgi:hypothetical protein